SSSHHRPERLRLLSEPAINPILLDLGIAPDNLATEIADNPNQPKNLDNGRLEHAPGDTTGKCGGVDGKFMKGSFIEHPGRERKASEPGLETVMIKMDGQRGETSGGVSEQGQVPHQDAHAGGIL